MTIVQLTRTTCVYPYTPNFIQEFTDVAYPLNSAQAQDAPA